MPAGSKLIFRYRTTAPARAVLLADEPASSLDDGSTRAMVAVLANWVETGGALVLVAHDAHRYRALADDERIELGT